MRIKAIKIKEPTNHKCVPMVTSDIKKFQKLLAEIGSNKKKGFLFVVEMSVIKDKKGGHAVKTEGLSFAHMVDKALVLKTVLDAVQLSSRDLIRFIELQASPSEVIIKSNRRK